MARSTITLTTDFGTDSPYVAQMKAAILCINPETRIVDICHSVPPQNVLNGALVLADTAPKFPPGTVHVAVVDPGVGSDRKIVAAAIASQVYIAPDNGLLTLVAQASPPGRITALTNSSYWRASENISSTFHGRDIMAPVAAHITQGVPLEQLGEPIDGLVPLDIPLPQVEEDRIHGQCLRVDTFGNLISNIDRQALALLGGSHAPAVFVGGHAAQWVNTYAQATAGSLVALVGSNDKLEIAVVNGSAARLLNAYPGTEIFIVRK